MDFKKEMSKIDKNINKEFKQLEKWVIERKKFFIKLSWIVGIIIILLIFSKFYL